MYRRPTYESASNLADEKYNASIIEAWAKCKLVKQPMSKFIDWIAYRDDIPVATIEFKKRNNLRAQYPTYMVSKAKWDNGIAAAHDLKVPFLMCIRWSDGLHYLPVTPQTPITTGTGGRRDRGDNADIEPMVYVDTNLFKRICQ